MPPHYTDRVRLSEAISGLRRELRLAAERAQALDPKERFRITEAELELTTIAEDGADGAAEVGWWVLKGNAQVSLKDSNSQKVRLKLNLGQKAGSNL
jgi:hypothetical protein